MTWTCRSRQTQNKYMFVYNGMVLVKKFKYSSQRKTFSPLNLISCYLNKICYGSDPVKSVMSFCRVSEHDPVCGDPAGRGQPATTAGLHSHRTTRWEPLADHRDTKKKILVLVLSVDWIIEEEKTEGKTLGNTALVIYIVQRCASLRCCHVCS